MTLKSLHFLNSWKLMKNILSLHPNWKESKQPPRRTFRKNTSECGTYPRDWSLALTLKEKQVHGSWSLPFSPSYTTKLSSRIQPPFHLQVLLPWMLMLITCAYKAKKNPLNFIGLDRAIFQKAAVVGSVQVYWQSL